MAAICLLLLAAAPGAARGGAGRVLLVSSYHPGFPTFFQQADGLRGVLEPAGVSLDVEFMDTKRFPSAEAVPRFLEMMRFKLARTSAYDAVAVADDAALRFVLDHGAELFPGRPVVFFGINNQGLAHELAGKPGFTGVIETVSMRETIDDVRRLLPRAAAVHAVVDDQPGGQGDLRTFLALRDSVPGLRLEALRLDAMDWRELGRRLQALPRDDAVLLLSAYRDRSAAVRSFDEGLAFILQHARGPVFHLWEHGLGQGLLGGKIISHETQASLAGGLLLRILAGESAESLPVVEGDDANRHVFDHAVLKRFGIDESLLPPGSEVRGRPVSAFSRYRVQILVLAGGVSLLLGLVAALLFHVARLRRAKSRLADSEARYKALFDANADGILVAECSTRRFVFANPAACRMFGYPVEEFRALGVADIHPAEHLAEVIANFEQQASGEKDIAEGSSCLRRDGSVFLADIRSFPLDIDGRPCAVGLFRDVTERSQVLDALRQARDAAEAANRSKSEFLANMSHEIRTPLNGVTGMLQLLDVTSPTPEQREYIRLALTSSMRLTRLLADILDLSRIEAGKLVLESRPFSLEEVRRSTLSLLSMAARERGLSLDFELHPGLPDIVQGDQARLQQVLFNLAGNGIKFSQEGGVRVQASPLPARGDGLLRVLFVVEDTGIGISDDLLEEVFQPFVQGEGAYVRRFQGAGLGLSIVRRLVRLMDGTLAVDSGPGGTTFCLALPFAPGAEPVGSGAGAGSARPGGGPARKILLAEDDEVSRRTVTSMLKGFGYEVVAVSDGSQAVQRLREEDFDAVVMDIQMPLMDGVEATRVIRSDASLGARAQVPIIAMTAYAMTGDREKFLAAGMGGYVPKPVDMEDLRDAMDSSAGRRAEPAKNGREG